MHDYRLNSLLDLFAVHLHLLEASESCAAQILRCDLGFLRAADLGDALADVPAYAGLCVVADGQDGRRDAEEEPSGDVRAR